ncbi:FRG domain-containing protein [Pseudoduganella sp. R-43]|uniref:FRG domain-containing protein n=1 Tax=Pseudoduganella sp. R-43 TaxID=3404063 RepID=UPI003CE7DE8E
MLLPLQAIGSIQTSHGEPQALFCRDVDRPDEAMIQWAPLEGQPGEGVLVKLIATKKDTFALRPITFFLSDQGGGLYAPANLPNYDELTKYVGELHLKGNSLVGNWAGAGTGGRMRFEIPSKPGRVKAMRLKNWQAFKVWASQTRETGEFVDFRGHGSNQFTLSTSLHRIGRTRSERFCFETIPEFRAHAEAILDTKFSQGNADDLSTVLALAQHHGLPTPLLDWTASPYVAAFFAFADAVENRGSRPDDTHVRIYALSKAVASTAAPTVVITSPAPHISHLSIGPWKNPRLLAQQGRFTVSNVADMEHMLCMIQKKTGVSLVSAVDVPISEATAALSDLKFMGLSAATMFPGLDGLCRMMRHAMALRK